MAETGQYFDRHPVTGEPGRWRLFQDQGYVNLDPNAPKDVYWNQRNQNYLGELGQYYAVNPNTGEVSVDEEGNPRWYFSGTLGWLNTKPAEIQPDSGGITFGMTYRPDRQADTAKALQQPAGGDGASTDALASTTQATTDSASMASMGGTTGGYAPSTPMTLGYQLPSLSSISATGGVDYVKMLNSALAADVMSGMLTGRGRIV